MTTKNNSNALKGIIVLLVIIIIGWILYDYSSPASQPPANSTTSSGTTTESAPTTTATSTATSSNVVVNTSDWKTISSSTTGVTFLYPAELSTNYIQTADWPPYITVASGPFSCLEPGTEETINGNAYCVTLQGEGAAGSIYTQYTYAFDNSAQVMSLHFTLRAPQCENYPDLQMTWCKNEESSFNVNSLADAMAQSVQYIPVVSPAHPQKPPVTNPNTYQLDSVSPGSGRVGMTIVLTGSGFLQTNKVLFDGNIAVSSVAAGPIVNGYQTLTITVPSGISPDCMAGEACPQYERLVTPGSYLVTVENGNGTTNAIPFIVESN